RSKRSQRRSAGMHGLMHNRRRSRCRASQGTAEKPAGARAGCARVGCQHMDVLSDDPAVPEKRRAVRFARCESDHRVRCLAFLVTFWAMPKSDRLAVGETKLCTSGAKIKMDSRLRAGMAAKRKELDSGLRRNDERKSTAKNELE